MLIVESLNNDANEAFKTSLSLMEDSEGIEGDEEGA
jgi:hypothetical protein